MLVLSRRKNEGIVIGEGIVVRVIAIEDGRVRLGIEASREVSIHREEVYEAIKEENREASRAASQMMDALDVFKALKP